MKENRKKPEAERVRQPSSTNRAEQRKRQCQRQRRQYRMLLIVVPLLLILIAAIAFLTKDPLAGTWHIDDVTSYRFNGRGKGALVLPNSEYEFTYEVEGNSLYIDFANEGAKDAEYVFQVSGGILTLNGGNATTKGEYTLARDGK